MTTRTTQPPIICGACGCYFDDWDLLAEHRKRIPAAERIERDEHTMRCLTPGEWAWSVLKEIRAIRDLTGAYPWVLMTTSVGSEIYA